MSYDAPPPPPPPPPYGAPPPGAVPAANHPRATLILVLGILSIPCCGLFTGIPAIILGNNAKKEIAASGGTIGGSGAVNAGYICGIIGTVLSVIGIIANVALRMN
jgi:hypothetical protein